MEKEGRACLKKIASGRGVTCLLPRLHSISSALATGSQTDGERSRWSRIETELLQNTVLSRVVQLRREALLVLITTLQVGDRYTQK